SSPAAAPLRPAEGRSRRSTVTEWARRRLAHGPVGGVFPERERTHPGPGIHRESSEIRIVVRVHRLLLKAPTSGVLGFNIHRQARPNIESAWADLHISPLVAVRVPGLAKPVCF